MKPRPPAAPTEMTGMFKRVFLFVATNLAVLALLSVVMSVLGVNPDQFGGLLVMAALFGFGGAFVSLLMSKWIAKRSEEHTSELQSLLRISYAVFCWKKK